MSISFYYPEMNEVKPVDVVGEVTRAYYGKHYFVKTTLELKGRGISLEDTYNESNCNNPDKYGWNRYKVTNLAMDKLSSKYNFSQELLLD